MYTLTIEEWIHRLIWDANKWAETALGIITDLNIISDNIVDIVVMTST